MQSSNQINGSKKILLSTNTPKTLTSASTSYPLTAKFVWPSTV